MFPWVALNPKPLVKGVILVEILLSIETLEYVAIFIL